MNKKCPFCGSEPQWMEKQPSGRDGAFELPLRAFGCRSPTCHVRPHTKWENDGHFDAAKHGNVYNDPSGLAHLEAWNLRL